MRFAHQDSLSTLELPAAIGSLELISKVLYLLFGHFSHEKSEPHGRLEAETCHVTQASVETTTPPTLPVSSILNALCMSNDGLESRYLSGGSNSYGVWPNASYSSSAQWVASSESATCSRSCSQIFACNVPQLRPVPKWKDACSKASRLAINLEPARKSYINWSTTLLLPSQAS